MRDEAKSSGLTVIGGFLAALTAASAALYAFYPARVWAILGVVAAFGALITLGLTAGRPSLRLAFIFVTACIGGVLLGSLISSPSSAGNNDYARRLSVVFRHLDKNRDASYRRLGKAHTPKRQARILRRLDATFLTQVRRLRRMGAGADHAASVLIAKRLNAIAHDFGSLARAVADPTGSRKRVRKARTRIRRADRNLLRAERRLAHHGYSIKPLP